MTSTGSKNPISLLSALALAVALTGCGAPASDEATSTDPEQGQDVTLPESAPEANGILELLNDAGTDLTLLDETVGLDRRAAENLIAHRDGDDTLTATGGLSDPCPRGPPARPP